MSKLFTLLFLGVIFFSEIKGSAGDQGADEEDSYEHYMALFMREENWAPVDFGESNEQAMHRRCQEELEVERRQQVHLAWVKTKTPLTLAAAKPDFEAVQLLLANNADVNEKDGEGKTALMEAVSRVTVSAYQKDKASFKAIIRCLLEGRADVNQVNNQNKNALMLSMMLKGDDMEEGYIFDEEVVTLLIDAKTDLTCRDDARRTVLDYTVYCDESVIDLLVEAYVEPDQKKREKWLKEVEMARYRCRRSGRGERGDARRADICWPSGGGGMTVLE